MVIRMISSFLSSVTPIVRLKRSIKLAGKGGGIITAKVRWATTGI